MESDIKKRMIILVLFVAIMVIIAVLLLMDINDKENFDKINSYEAVDVNGNIIQLHENLGKEIATEHYQFSNLKMKVVSSNKTEISIDVKNITEDVALGKMMSMHFYDIDGNKIGEALLFVSSISKGATEKYTAIAEGDITKAYQMEIKE